MIYSSIFNPNDKKIFSSNFIENSDELIKGTNFSEENEYDKKIFTKKDNEYRFKNNIVEINKTLVLPENSKLIIEPGTKIFFKWLIFNYLWLCFGKRELKINGFYFLEKFNR